MKNIKNFILNKKIVAILLLLITILTNVSPVFAASGSSKYTGGQFASGMITTEEYNEGNGILIRRLIDMNTNEKYTVFCIEHGTNFETGPIYNGSYYTPTNEKVRKACKVAYFGWYEKYGEIGRASCRERV